MKLINGDKLKIDELESKKMQIISGHIRRCNDTELSKAEKWIIKELDWEINQIRSKS